LTAAGIIPGIPATGGARAVARQLPKLDDKFDAASKIGGDVPIMTERFGRVEHMRPSDFLRMSGKLEEPDPNSMKFLKDKLQKGEKVGNPYLVVGEAEKGAKVFGHEGRHRMKAIQELYGDEVLVPVYLVGKYQKGQELAKTTPLSKIISERAPDHSEAYTQALLRESEKLVRQSNELVQKKPSQIPVNPYSARGLMEGPTSPMGKAVGFTLDYDAQMRQAEAVLRGMGRK
jgi:hypothetical protein